MLLFLFDLSLDCVETFEVVFQLQLNLVSVDKLQSKIKRVSTFSCIQDKGKQRKKLFEKSYLNE